MSIANAHANLKALLTANTALAAWANTHFGKAVTALDGNRPLQTFNQAELPALVFDLGDGNNQPLSNNRFTEVTQTLNFAYVFFQPDMGAAFNARKALPDLVTLCVLAANTLGGVVSHAHVVDWSFAQGSNDPEMHSVRFAVQVTYGLKL